MRRRGVDLCACAGCAKRRRAAGAERKGRGKKEEGGREKRDVEGGRRWRRAEGGVRRGSGRTHGVHWGEVGRKEVIATCEGYVSVCGDVRVLAPAYAASPSPAAVAVTYRDGGRWWTTTFDVRGFERNGNRARRRVRPVCTYVLFYFLLRPRWLRALEFCHYPMPCTGALNLGHRTHFEVQRHPSHIPI